MNMMLRQQLHRWWLLAQWLIICAIGSLYTLAQPPTKLWSINLNGNADFYKRASILEVSLTPPSVGFLNDDQIICGFYDREEIGFDPSVKGYVFHVLAIDARTGRFGRELDFQSENDNSRALPVADGGFVVLAGQELKKFTSSFTPSLSYPTPIGGTYQLPDLWRMDVAPGGDRILLYHRHGKEGSEFRWITSNDLTEFNKIPTGYHAIALASNSAILINDVRDRVILSDQGTRPLCNRCEAYFLTDDLVFIDREREYSIETTEGERRGGGRLDLGVLHFARAATASRFAYETGHYTRFRSLSGEIRVQDWSTNQRVADIRVNEPAGNPSDGLNQMALALSPDGKYLAVLLHHTLSCYRLP
ncbi:MAG: hypothetical protein WCE75_16715 [Terracidiphilus sp.]